MGFNKKSVNGFSTVNQLGDTAILLFSRPVLGI
jgi:hypothetical protein